jgi:hypothetical protein
LPAIWKELLGKERIGIHDNFFELGGHSLLAMQVISAIRRVMEVEVAIKELFVHPTIGELARTSRDRTKTYTSRYCSDRSSPWRIPLSFSQERLWFIDRLEGSLQYHLPSVLLLRGKLNLDAFVRAFQDIVNRHEVLRTVFYEYDGKAWQHILDRISGTWILLIGSSMPETQLVCNPS